MMQVMALTHTARNLILEKSFVLKKGLDCGVAFECTIIEGLACEIAYECTCRMIYIGIEIYGYYGNSRCDWTVLFSRA